MEEANGSARISSGEFHFEFHSADVRSARVPYGPRRACGQRHRPGFADTDTEVPWANIIGMRHKVVHDYLGVDEDIVWQVVTTDLPKLVAVLVPLSRQRRNTLVHAVLVACRNSSYRISNRWASGRSCFREGTRIAFPWKPCKPWISMGPSDSSSTSRRTSIS